MDAVAASMMQDVSVPMGTQAEQQIVVAGSETQNQQVQNPA